MKKIKADRDVLRDAFNIFDGVYSPVTGFLKRSDLGSVLFNMRLSNGEVWPIPIIFNIGAGEAGGIKNGDKVILVDEDGVSRALLREVEVYGYDKNEYVRRVFGTEDISHPGVAEIQEAGEYLLGGEVEWVDPERPDPAYYLDPARTREMFRHKGWRTVVAFQTRNIPHRSHEYLQKRALEVADGLFIHPVLGKKKPGDFKDELILAGYEALLQSHYPEGKYHLGSLPLKMRYAGPREAVMHALIRRNFGCTHMIIGRDHAGIEGFYDPFEAQRIFDGFKAGELGIEILKFGEVKHCPECGGLSFVDDCLHDRGGHISLSGTAIREMIKRGEKLPEELIRPEVSKLLLDHPEPFV